MESHNSLYANLAAAFSQESFLQKLSRPDEAPPRETDWRGRLAPLLPIRTRISCAEALEVFCPLLSAPEPEEGWLSYVYRTAVSLLFPRDGDAYLPRQRDAALCFLQFLQVLFDAEREALPFDFWLDFAFCTEEELRRCAAAEEYRLFLRRWREEYVYELLRLGREVTSFRTLEHIAGVHQVSMLVSRAFRANGGPWDALPPTTLFGTWSWKTSLPSLWFWCTVTSG